MSSQITGELLNPIGAPMSGAIVRIVAKENAESTLISSEVDVPIGDSGGYDFTLLEGTYAVFLKQEDTYVPLGETFVDSNSPGTMTLTELLNQG